MNPTEEYFLIHKDQLPAFEKEGWRLVGRHRRLGYRGCYNHNVLVKRRVEGNGKEPPRPEVQPL